MSAATVENLRDTLYNGVLANINPNYPFIKITDAYSERLADDYRNEKGVSVWLSRTSIRVPQRQVRGAVYMTIGFTICIETNKQVPDAPAYNDVLDNVISAVLKIPKDPMGQYWLIYKSEEITESPGNGLLTVLFPYQQ